MQMLKQQLSLTDDQTTQLKAIYADERTKMMALRDDTTTPQEDKRGKMQAIRKDGEEKLEAMLTPDQKTKYAAMREHMRDQMRERRGAPGAPGEAPPPPQPPPQQ
jgi:protein CpxP